MASRCSRSIGILALQGDFAAHQSRLKKLGHDTILIKTTAHLSLVNGLVIPGGESTTLLRLLTKDLRAAIVERIEEGMPVLATCAGVILLAKHVSSPAQDSLGLLDISVERNSYGRQVDSFFSNELKWTTGGRKLLDKQFQERAAGIYSSSLEGIFIRAPRITQIGPRAEAIIELNSDPVLVRQGNILAATFHPEITDGLTIIHELFGSYL